MRDTAAIVTLVIAALVGVTPPLTSRAQAATGSIEGRIIFGGAPPTPIPGMPDGGSQQVLYVDRSGGLRYAVVFLPDAKTGRVSARPATMNQRNFVFEPQVLGIRAGQTVRFTSDDSANHNVRTKNANGINTFNITTAPGSVGPDTHRFAPTPVDRPLELSCDIHPWMAAWVYVFDHDQFAVTQADGAFRIEKVPAGRHRLAVRQPSGRLARDLAVDVKAGETTRLDVRFTAADIGMPSR
jgi:plastocyanin